ncbi:TonB-dependent receptor plug domain-containing protein [Paraglaciecola sp.]|uniref:TonB-dependent receptor plug domain-containing protein n=1 Tax=Paraglaciecola sp. TaxID=1920173 RepID=UPI003F4A89DD
MFDYSLEELLQLNTSTGTLTSTQNNRIPASLTYISQQDIIDSGARRLNELLEIMVPNLQLVRHNYGPQHLGMRGVINDRENTYLFVVNGKAMNEKSLRGVIMERDLPMLGDIKKIEVIRGPGSAVYGPGALSGVINITTLSGKDFQGSEVTIKQGAIEQFTSLEVKHSKQLGKKKDTNLMFYYGLTDYSGASDKYTPHIVSVNTEYNGQPYLQAGLPVPYSLPNDKGSSLNRLKHKLHLQFDSASQGETQISAWLRYTKGGDKVAAEHSRNNTEFSRGNQRYMEPGYQQLSAHFETNTPLSNDDELFFNISYDFVDSDRSDNAYKGDTYDLDAQRLSSYREDKYASKLIYKKQMVNIKTALGAEVSYDTLGLPGVGSPNIAASIAGIYPNGVRRDPDELLAAGEWTVLSYAYFGELQWKINNDWTLFTGARYDKHDYTDWFFSPRTSLVFTQSDSQIWKLLYNKSIKTAGEFDLRSAYLEGGRASEESLESIELTYSHTLHDGLNYQLAVFAQEIDFWSFSSPRIDESSGELIKGFNQPVGIVSMWGGELEVSYEKDTHKLSLSHSYTKLIDIKQSNNSQYISAKAYGFGNDLNTWSNHISKLFYRWQFQPTWRFTASARIYWGFQGAEDWADYNNSRNQNNQARFGYDQKGEAFSGNYFVNLGVHKTLSDKLDISLNAYNVMGWIDKDYNKRNYIKRSSDYRPEAASVAIQLSYKF